MCSMAFCTQTYVTISCSALSLLEHSLVVASGCKYFAHPGRACISLDVKFIQQPYCCVLVVGLETYLAKVRTMVIELLL